MKQEWAHSDANREDRETPAPATDRTPAVDFTYRTYASLLHAATESGYSFATVREYLTADRLPDKLVVSRHDVDRKPERALDLARIESQAGVASTYYFRTVDRTFDPRLIREIEALGHEVGYHYEDLDRADGDVDAAHDYFRANLRQLREVCTVDTVCMHGNPLTPHDNRDMWTNGRSVGDYDLAGEAYLSVDFTDLTYFTDTGRTWRDGSLKIKDTTVGPTEKRWQADGTDDLIRLVRDGRVRRPYVLTHPNRWAGTYGDLLYAATVDTAINVGKRALRLVR